MSDSAEKLLESYPIMVRNTVAWGDMDAFQHVNNIMYFRYFENARVEYGIRIRITDRMESEGVGPILKWADCKYIRPMTFPDTALIGARSVSIEGSDMKMEYAIVSEKQREIVAVGNSLGVFYNYRLRERVDFPAELIARIEKLEGRSILVGSSG